MTKAGKVIVLIVALLSLLNSVGQKGLIHEANSPHSLLSRMGREITPIFKPMGMTEENWPAAVGL